MLKSLLTNWKTTAAGVGILLATIGNAISQYSAGGFAGVDVKVLFMGLSAAIAAFSAKDANVTGGTVVQAAPEARMAAKPAP
jgi:hypothetical protein